MRRWLLLLWMLWLPLVSGNALAATLLMSVPAQAASCHEAASATPAADSDAACAQCAFCQMACAACLPTPLLNFSLPVLSPVQHPVRLSALPGPDFPPLDPPPIAA